MGNIYISTIELAEQLGISQREARTIIKMANEKQKEQGLYVVKARPSRALKKEVAKLLGIGEIK